jgi:hypothetical protein
MAEENASCARVSTAARRGCRLVVAEHSGDVRNTDIAFSSAAAIMTWTMMNVNNPDPRLMLEDRPPLR